MSLLIDIIVIVAFAMCFTSGVKKGFVKSVINIIIVAVAIIGTINITPSVAPYINDKFIKKPVVSVAEDAVSKLVSDSVDIDTLVNEQPQAFVTVLKRFGVEPEEIRALFKDDTQETDDEKTDRIANYIATPIASAISKATAFIVVFILLLIILFIASFFITMLVKLPVLKTADKLLGGVFGIVTGLVLAWGISIAICALMPHLSVVYEGSVPDSVIENSIVVKALGSIDIISYLK